MPGLALATVWILLLISLPSQSQEEPPQWPQPNSVLQVRGSTQTSHHSPSILIVLNMYSLIHWDVVDEHFSAYRDICEGGWSLKVIILTAADWSNRLLKWAHRNLHCYRDTNSLSMEVRRFNQTVGRRIVDYSRVPVSQYIDDFDIFYFAEDDMILTYSLLTAWHKETEELIKLTKEEAPIIDKQRCGWKAPCKYTIGMENIGNVNEEEEYRTNLNSWQESYIIDKNRLEEEPVLDPICIGNKPYISIYTNSHQAGWILTKDDVKDLNNSCNFLHQYYYPHWKNSGMVREYMNSLSIYRNTWFVTRPLNCMVLKVIPAIKLELFKYRHFYRSKDTKQNTMNIYDADELTRQGIDYTTVPHGDVMNKGKGKIRETPPCWKGLEVP